MKNLANTFFLAVTIIAATLFDSCRPRDEKTGSSPAHNREDSTGLLPKENVKTASEDYQDTSTQTPSSQHTKTDDAKRGHPVDTMGSDRRRQ